jgi:hypothetical protein
MGALLTASEEPTPPDDGRPAVDPAARWIKSAEMHKIMRRHLKSFVSQYGFKVSREGIYGWARQFADRHLVFWVQANKYNDPLGGGSFTMEFQFSEHKGAAVGASFGERARIGSIMDPADLPHYAEIRLRVLNEIPVPVAGQRCFAGGRWWSTESVRFALDLRDGELRTQVKIPDDIWFPFFTADHVEAWGGFLAPRMPSLARAFIEKRIAASALPTDSTCAGAIEEARMHFPGDASS